MEGWIERSVLTAALVVLAVYDLRTRRLPNWLTFPLWGAGLLVRGLEGQLSTALWGTLLGFVPFFVLFALGAMGAGDVKLLAGLGAWLGPAGLLTTLAWAALLFFLALLLQGDLFRALANIGRGLYSLALSRVYPGVTPTLPRSRNIPFGVYLALGALIAIWMEGGHTL